MPETWDRKQILACVAVVPAHSILVERKLVAQKLEVWMIWLGYFRLPGKWEIDGCIDSVVVYATPKGYRELVTELLPCAIAGWL